jgi:mRNA export factor
MVKMWNAKHGNTAASVQNVGRHDQPIRNLKFVPESNILITSSWDKSIRAWDCRQRGPVWSLSLSERIYAMDAKKTHIVACTADRSIHIINITTASKMGQYVSPLDYQSRCVSVFHDDSGFALGSIEGRVAIEYFSDLEAKISATSTGTKAQGTKSFAFKCHRHNTDIYPVNAVDCHPNDTFASAGADGTFHFWDKDAKTRLAAFESFKKLCPITACKFSPRGDMFFYALSYDWSKGYSGNTDPALTKRIMFHSVAEATLKK